MPNLRLHSFSLISALLLLSALPAAGAEKLCALYPHLKDSYWLSVNYGMVEEARKLNLNLRVMEAGGYPNHHKQQQQIACAYVGELMPFCLAPYHPSCTKMI